VHNKVVLWKPLLNEDESNRTPHSSYRIPSSILFLREFNLDFCDSWYVRFDSLRPYHNLLALGNQKGEVKVWKIDDELDQKHFCKLTPSGWFGDQTSSTVRMVAFNPHGSHLVAVRDDSTVWMWDTR
jgi:WD40 repeat protein